jgi:hypothetical protein
MTWLLALLLAAAVPSVAPKTADQPSSYLEGCYNPTADTTWASGVIQGPAGLHVVAGDGTTWVDDAERGWVDLSATLPGRRPTVTSYAGDAVLATYVAQDAIGCPQYTTPPVIEADPTCPAGEHYSSIPPAGCRADTQPVTTTPPGLATASQRAVRSTHQP